MQKNIFKKIIALTFITTFLFGLFVPFNQSLATESTTVTLSAGSTTISSGQTTTITATIPSTKGGQTISFFTSGSGSYSFSKKTCSISSENTEKSRSCSVTFGSSVSEEESYLINVNVYINGEPNNYTVSTVTIIVKNPISTVTIDTKTPATTKKDTDTETTYTPLAPLPGLEEGEDFDTDQDCAFGVYLNIIIKVILGLAAVLAMVMIVMGGVEYITSELVSSKEAGKERMTHAILGLLIALGAYLILNTINPALLNVCLDLPTAEIVVDDSVPQTPVNGMYCTKTPGVPSGGYKNGADWASIAGAVASLPTGVVSNHPNTDCIKVGDQNCTSLRGLNTNIIDNIKNKCGNDCKIIVTAGTECWLHGGKNQNTTHHPNSPTVDVRATNSANMFFTGTTKFPNDNKPYNKGGVSCVAEPANTTSSTTGSHWHCQ